MMSPRTSAENLLQFIDASPTPWHAVANVEARLKAHGFKRCDEGHAWELAPGDCGYVIRDDSSIIAFRLGDPSLGLKIVGAHTDSPGFRVKPRAAHVRSGVFGLGVEVYGGPIIASFADRDLTLAGRVLVKTDGGAIGSRLVNFERPLLRLPNLAIHLNRDVNTAGLRFDLQKELPLVLGSAAEQLPADEEFRQMLADALQLEAKSILSWELAVFDVQGGAFFGKDDEFIAAGRLDNLASCHAGLDALLAGRQDGSTQVLALFDHEEVGSQSFKGADGTFLQDTVTAIAAALGRSDEVDRRRMLSRSILLSVDMSHALHPNFAHFHDPQHAVRLNEGPVIKINAKQRYATDGVGEAYFESLCEQVKVPCQKYVHRNDLPCGSTIGPIAAGRLGVRTVDVGNPMWSMHSARESAGAHDHAMMIKVLGQFYDDTVELLR